MNLAEIQAVIAYTHQGSEIDMLFTQFLEMFSTTKVLQELEGVGLDIISTGTSSNYPCGAIQLFVHQTKLITVFDHVWLVNGDDVKFGGRIRFMRIKFDDELGDCLLELRIDNLGNMQIGEDKNWLYSVSATEDNKQLTCKAIILTLLKTLQEGLVNVES